ncbi:hypothetical protein B0H13DRAFT_1888207 [Mycena leptocephala]|nr:hypothetical protein B0H13DRAFT_1888207 [Mycena leptocephala]
MFGTVYFRVNGSAYLISRPSSPNSARQTKNGYTIKKFRPPAGLAVVQKRDLITYLSDAILSSAIYSSANLLYQLIEEESAHAIKPYKDALDALQSQLHRLANENTAIARSAESSEKDLAALKGILAEAGLGIGSAPSGRASLHFIGDSANLVAYLADKIKRFAPETAQPFRTAAQKLRPTLAQSTWKRRKRRTRSVPRHRLESRKERLASLGISRRWHLLTTEDRGK